MKGGYLSMLDLLASILGLCLKAYSAYFVVIAAFAFRRNKGIQRHTPQTRFACLIAARNEEDVIGKLIHSLRAQNYPDDLYDIFVIPNNCTDQTEKAARIAGAKILHCMGRVTKKGDALHEAIACLLPQDYDAFCVFDADNIVHEDFLARMNDALSSGVRIARGAMKVKNPYDSWISGCYGLYFTLMDLFFNRARTNCGLSARLNGTGFAVHREVLEKMGGWNTDTIAEDAEFYTFCVLHGYRICFVPKAITFDEATNSFAISMIQRMRWCSGIMDVSQKKTPELLSASVRTGGRRAWDTIMIINGSFVQVASICPPLLSFFKAVGNGSFLSLCASFGVGLVFSWLGCILLAAALAWVGGYRDRKILKTVLCYPLFTASWLPLNVISLLHRTKNWKVIPHGQKNVRARDLLLQESNYPQPNYPRRTYKKSDYPQKAERRQKAAPQWTER